MRFCVCVGLGGHVCWVYVWTGQRGTRTKRKSIVSLGATETPPMAGGGASRDGDSNAGKNAGATANAAAAKDD